MSHLDIVTISSGDDNGIHQTLVCHFPDTPTPRISSLSKALRWSTGEIGVHTLFDPRVVRNPPAHRPSSTVAPPSTVEHPADIAQRPRALPFQGRDRRFKSCCWLEAGAFQRVYPPGYLLMQCQPTGVRAKSREFSPSSRKRADPRTDPSF